MLILDALNIEAAFKSIMLSIDAVVFGLINSSFKIFMAIAGARLLSSDAYTTIANKIYIIIGVVMLFVLAYAIIRAIIDPDQMTKGDLSGPKILKNIVVAVIGLAIAPVLFNMMYQAQSLFLEHDVLVKLFFRGGDETINVGDVGEINVDSEVKNVGGGVTSITLWKAFFYPSGGSPDDIVADVSDYWVNQALSVGGALLCALGIVGGIAAAIASWGTLTALGAAAAVAGCTYSVVQAGTAEDKIELMEQYGDQITLSQAYAYASAEGDFAIFSAFVDNIVNKEITYMMFVSLICGGFVCYAFVSFSIDMGVRAAKLAYYQIIAPIPLILQILPKWKDTFSKYLREVINTFVEVFVRISVVYIVVYIICHLESLFSNVGELFGNDNLNAVEGLIAYALLIIGLVIFAKQAPKMISETFGLKSGSMSLGIGKKLAEGGAYTAGAAIGGGITAGVRNARNRFIGADNWKNKSGKVTAGSVVSNLGRGLFSTAAGLGSGFGRSGWAARGAKSFSDMKKGAASGANAAVDAKNARDERRAKAESDENVKAIDAQIEAAKDELKNATSLAEKTKISAKIAGLTAMRRASISGANINNRVEDLKDSVNRWSAGTVDMSKEEADIKFAEALKKANEDAREVAIKKDGITQNFKDAYDELMRKEVDKYKAGWNAESYNAALNSALGALESERSRTVAAVDTARIARERAGATLTAARLRGVEGEELTRLEGQLRAAEAVLAESERIRTDFEANFDSRRAAEIASINSEAKLTDDEIEIARQQLVADRKAAKERYEAAADSYVLAESTKGGTQVATIFSQLISNNAEYISSNAGRQIVVDIDSDGHEVVSTIADIVGKSFGSSAVENGTIDVSAIRAAGKKGNYGNEIVIVGEDGNKKTYNIVVEGGNVKYQETTGDRDEATGRYATTGVEYTAESFSDVLRRAKSVENQSRIVRASKTGKRAAEVIPQSTDYRSKATRKRKAEEKK